MDREIKFRAWDVKNKRMYFAFQVDSQLGVPCNIALPFGKNWAGSIVLDNQEDLVIMQYTNVKDKKENYIYEGDIVKKFNHGKYRIVWTFSEWWLLSLEDNENKDGLKLSDQATHSTQTKFGQGDLLEVIGNIYENPELLNNN